MKRTQVLLQHNWPAKSSLDGKLTGAASALPALKPGMLIVFVSAPDAEYAEFLLASRASANLDLGCLPSKISVRCPHRGSQACYSPIFSRNKAALTSNSTRASESLASPAYAELKSATQLAFKANSILPADSGSQAINEEVTAATDTIAKKGSAELPSYRKPFQPKPPAMNICKPPISSFRNSSEIDPQNPSVVKFDTDATKETNTYESAIHTAQNLISSNHVDDAMKTVFPYLSFLAEDPRIAEVVNSSYSAHFNKGKSLADSNNWAEASREFDLANNIKPSPEAASALANAKKELEKANNNAAAEAALRQSKEYASQSDFISAYEVLDNLPADQRILVDADRTASRPHLRDQRLPSGATDPKSP